MIEKKQIFKLDGKVFSLSNPLIIAEIGTSHNGSLKKAKELIEAALYAGATAVKFQIVYADELLHPNTGIVKLPTGNIPLYDRFKTLELPISFYKELSEYAKMKNLLFSASPFGFKSADELNSLNPDFIKIASPELNFIQLLLHCAKFSRPMILSTGVSLLSDIEKAVLALKNFNSSLQIALLHCITAYPAPETEYNVSLIENLASIFSLPVGISDHSLDSLLVPLLTLAHGGFIFEKHICLSRNEKGLDDPVALEPEMFKKMCSFIKEYKLISKENIIKLLQSLNYSLKIIHDVIGNGEKKLSNCEKENYSRTNRSIHYTKNLKANTIITKNDIAILRTEKLLSIGEAPEFFDFFIGAVLKKEVKSGEGVLKEHFIMRKNE